MSSRDDEFEMKRKILRRVFENAAGGLCDHATIIGHSALGFTMLKTQDPHGNQRVLGGVMVTVSPEQAVIMQQIARQVFGVQAVDGGEAVDMGSIRSLSQQIEMEEMSRN